MRLQDRALVFTDPLPFWVVGLGLFVLALLLRLACFTGLIMSDDINYSGFAQQIADLRYVPEYHHQAIRYGLLVPVALVYKLAGVSEVATVVVPLVASALAVVVLARIGLRMFGVSAAMIAALLLATFPLQLRYASILVPEPILSCYLLIGVLVYVNANAKASILRGAIAGAFVGLAYLTKEPALFVAPALVIHAALARRWRDALGVVLGVGLVIGAEHTYYVATTGDLLFRPHAMAVHNRNVGADLPPDDPDSSSRVDLVRRLFKVYPRRMLVPNDNFGIHSIAVLVLATIAVFRFRKDSRSHLLLLWAAIPWLYTNFGTTSFTRYVTIPPGSRYIDLCYPPLFLLAGWLIADVTRENPRLKRTAVVALATIMVVGVATGLSTRATEYRTDHVAVLRVLHDRLAAAPGGVCFDVPQKVRSQWHRTLVILTGRKVGECQAQDHVLLRADPYGLPYVAAPEP
jgi:4-amino-4-deoxy-L-arabinose transferase-like glycosyltransferase